MKLVSKVLAIAIATLPLAASHSDAAMQSITVNVQNISTFDHTYEMVDNKSGRAWDQFVGAGKAVAIMLQSSQAVDDGYGDLNYRIKGNTTWNHNGHLKNGETYTL